VTVKRPVGPCLFVTPWNFPLAMATRKIAPAIAAGCTMVLKPAELTPLTALLFAEVLTEAGLPPGVLNVITTTDPGAVTGPLLADPRLRKLSFTGSTAVGRKLLAQSADQVLRVSMELGGNAPFLVFEDADLDAAADGAVLAKLRNGGEACVAANRFLVHSSVAEEFTEKLATRMKTYPLGPLVDEKTRSKVSDLVADAVGGGARVVLGGKAPEGKGFFYDATVLIGIPAGARLLSEEIFGPVAPIITFDTEQDAIKLANATEYGLVCFAYTRDLNRGLRLAEALETGMLGLNTGIVSNPAAPFGGVKHSGIGREGGAEGIEEYLETTYVAVADPFSTSAVFGSA
jgi:succinate-semialdehyde dehydrogenase/glutarate-semialdehyde dehydrogenase